MAFKIDLLVDRLIPEELKRDEVGLRQARFQRYILLTTLLLSVLYALCLYAIDYAVGFWVLVGFVVLHVSFLAMLWQKVRLPVIGSAFCAMTIIGFLLLCVTSRGISSATIIWFFATIVSSFWLVGRRAGYYWGAASVLVVAGLFASEALGMRYPLLFPARYYYIYAGIANTGALLYAIIVVITYENWQKSAVRLARNLAEELQVQKQEAENQRDQTAHALAELTRTQQQLVEKEKMASLGELTAGIAHEIQNPLNFVNNFAEVSTELVAELVEEQARVAPDADLEADLLADLQQNLAKISQHGQRAANIVRSMLQHSRTSTGERTPTDLNALAEEYLRLAYHGARAQDAAFQASLETDWAPGLPPIEAVTSDLGRVLLNLLTNAFYAVRQRQRTGEPGYVPAVRVQTSYTAEQVRVRVQDNGLGMPAAVQAKIFQPFFTTKPTGEGTGLGLSLSYDIVTQSHGGTLAVQSQEGQGAVFTVALPR